ncbi:MAG TPA: hypothetical protein VFF04_07210 [Candidatus Babeliales bacterium]|nr:hypothetical protein [Candidatus Babeliales bacterium]
MKSIFLSILINILLSMPLIAAQTDSKCLILCDDKSVAACAQSYCKQFMKQTWLNKLGIGKSEQMNDSYKKCAIGCMTQHCVKVHWQIPLATKH